VADVGFPARSRFSADCCNPILLPSVDPALEDRLPPETPHLRAFLRKLAVATPSLEVDDLLQETMNRALKYRHSLDLDRPIRPWLQSIAFRVFVDARNQQKRAPQSVDPVVAAEGFADPGGTEGGGISAIRSDAADTRRLLDALDEPERSVMQLTYLQGKNTADVAAELKIAVGTIKSHLHRARRRLAARFRAEDWL
jgi:RNA polymerase sigma-70 factor, ECF subfamily